MAEVAARLAEAGDEFDKRCAAALAFGAEGDHYAEIKAWRKIIKEWPDEPTSYHNLAVAQLALENFQQACVSSQNARRLARLSLSYSNRWMLRFDATHRELV